MLSFDSTEKNIQHNNLPLVDSLANSEKIQRWEELTALLKETTDRLGAEIDSGIFETVVAFNAFGFKTTQSCEGHIDHGVAAPWVDIEAAEQDEAISQLVNKKFKQGDQIWRKTQEKNSHLVSQEEIDTMNQLWSEAHELRRKLDRPVIEERKKIIELLSEFYMGRQVPYDVQITLYPMGNGARILNMGAEIQDIETEEIKYQKLKTYQEEMLAFTGFLKKKYFS
jgi:hypothetical protein